MVLWSPPKPAVKAGLIILTAAFSGVADVSAKMPQQRPEQFVRVSRIGGSMADQVTDNARLLIECFGLDTETVESMCNTARAALRNAVGTTVDTDIYIRNWGNEFGPTDLPNPAILDRERWQFHGDLAVKAN